MLKPVALVTGATSGIGEACARRLLAAGYRVIITGRNVARLNALRDELGHDILPLVFDVRDREVTEMCVASLPETWKEIDVLVNNAGLALGLDREYEGDYRDWDTMIDTNIKGLLYMTRAVVPGMVERGRGHVINIGSVAGDAAYANGNVYCGTKAAVKSITDGLRIDVAHTPLRVTLIKPGLVETNFSNVRFHGDNDRADAVYKGIEPLTGADIADAVVYCVQAPAHVQIAEMLILATHQASGSVIVRQ
ncbi:MAG: SDR family NAD(P)-dependent oxidoreductase [Muribaculaceae bacterium]|nr:SDR family NAD(P)-dependent oxidoreductase [Muribaculaceae bacterium]MDE6803088.1 SDR family NAD(P)-dependent oxidoreductase [Muribaculaceae bacterium]MDE6842667.1 SDR family NAD(P)-dependent oxidoreductase [Muribaculaceae bacterium]